MNMYFSKLSNVICETNIFETDSDLISVTNYKYWIILNQLKYFKILIIYYWELKFN